MSEFSESYHLRSERLEDAIDLLRRAGRKWYVCDELFEAEPSKLFAQALGLEHYDWLAYDYIARDFHDSPEEHRDVTEVK